MIHTTAEKPALMGNHYSLEQELFARHALPPPSHTLTQFHESISKHSCAAGMRAIIRHLGKSSLFALWSAGSEARVITGSRDGPRVPREL